MRLKSPLKTYCYPHARPFNLRKVKFLVEMELFEQTRWKCVFVCDMIFAGALPPFSRTAVWEIPAAEAAEAAEAFNTQQTVI